MIDITVRRAVDSDLSELARLAALDSGTPPRGPALIAEADSRMLAALPLGSGRPIADPFEPTAEIVALLQMRAAQLRDADAATPRAGRAPALAVARTSLARARVGPSRAAPAALPPCGRRRPPARR